MRSIFLTLVILLAGRFVVAGELPVSLETLLREMVDRTATATECGYTCKQFSSYDRNAVSPEQNWFANNDTSQFLREEVNPNAEGRKEWVLLDATGPGAVVRWWITAPHYKNKVYIYVDGATEPVFQGKIDELIGGCAWCGAPLSEETARGRNLYLPIPYAKSLKITCDDMPEQGNLYYQINTRTYPAETPVVSFHPEQLTTWKATIDAVQKQLLDPESTVGLVRNADGTFTDEAENLDEQLFRMEVAGNGGRAEKRFPAPTAARVRKMSLRLTADDLVQALRQTVLVMKFDEKPSVRCPVGDFFGTVHGLHPYQTYNTRVAEDGTLTCYWEMPFAEEVSIAFENQAATPVTVEGTLGILEYSEEPESPSYFHCFWHQQEAIQTVAGNGTMDWNYGTLIGKGKYVGDVLSVRNRVRAWWGEGDEKIYVDDEAFPSHFGTGTEDYYGYAWCTPQYFQSPWRAQPFAEGPENDGHVTNLRFRALDAIPFEKSFRFDMEVWHWAATSIDYAAAILWYGDAETWPKKEIVQHLAPGEDNPRNSEGDFIRRKDGRILFVYTRYYGNSWADESPAYLAIIESADEGKTWSAPQKIVENEGGCNVMSVSLLRLQDGRMGLFYLRKNGISDCRPMVRFSSDEGKTWSEPRCCIDEVGYYVVNNSRVIQLPSGVILIPAALHRNTDGKFQPNAQLYCYRSTDGGQTWTRGGETPNPGDVVFQEPGLVPLSEGRLGMYIRTNRGCQYWAVSSDEGLTWTPGAPSPFVSPMSPMSIRPLPGTDSFLALWNESPNARDPMTVAVLDKDLRIVRKATLDTTQPNDLTRWFCYPAIFPLDDGTVLVGYCAGNIKSVGLNATRIMRLNGK